MPVTDEAALDEALYLASNPDVAQALEAGLIRSARAHWDEVGRGEQQAGTRPTLAAISPNAGDPPPRVADATFDAALYLQTNPDLRAVFGKDLEAARRHWGQHGSLEGRFGAGDAPYRGRAPDLAAILARPFGVDLFLAVEERDPAAVAGRRLLRSLRRDRIPVRLHPFVADDDIPRIAASDASRPTTFRVSLVAASPQTLRRLIRAYPDGFFDASYVVGLWPNFPFAPHLPDYPTFGAVDEVWVGSLALRDRLVSMAPVPVRLVGLAAASLPTREAARARLGLPLDATCVMLDADLVGDGQGGLCPPPHIPEIIGAWRACDRSGLLVLRADGRSLGAAEQAIEGLRRAVVINDQRHDGDGSLVLAACDAMIASVGLDADIADARQSGRAVIAPTLRAFEMFLRGESPTAPEPADPGSLRELLASLGLDAPAPRFAVALGRSRCASLAVPNWSDRPDVSPVVAILLDARASRRAQVERITAALAAGNHPFWELCVAGLRDSEAWLGRQAGEPRVRFAPSQALASRAAALNEAVACATASYAVVARSEAEALAAAEALAGIAAHLGSAADVLLVGDPSGLATKADRIEAGGAALRPVAIRLSALRSVGGFRDHADPATEYDVLLRILRARGTIACCPAVDAPARDPEPPAAAEASRLALQAHLQATVGPLGYAEPGLRPGTCRRRRHATSRLATTIVVAAGSVLDEIEVADVATVMRAVGAVPTKLAELHTEHVILLDARIDRIERGALTALLEFASEQEIGAVGARILHADGTLHHAGLVLAGDGSLIAPGHGQPADPAGSAGATVTNPDAVGGVLATRRSVLIEAGGFDDALLGAPGVGFDLLVADLCLRLARDLRLRTTCTPFARFRRAPKPATAADEMPNDAEMLFRRRWRS